MRAVTKGGPDGAPTAAEAGAARSVIGLGGSDIWVLSPPACIRAAAS